MGSWLLTICVVTNIVYINVDTHFSDSVCHGYNMARQEYLTVVDIIFVVSNVCVRARTCAGSTQFLLILHILLSSATVVLSLPMEVLTIANTDEVPISQISYVLAHCGSIYIFPTLISLPGLLLLIVSSIIVFTRASYFKTHTSII